MEQQQRFDGSPEERKPRAQESAPLVVPPMPATRPPAAPAGVESGGAALDGDLTIEEFELDDIEEIESKVFA